MEKDLEDWEVLHREEVVDAEPWIKVWKETLRLPDGKLVDDYYTVEQLDYVMIFALIDSDKVICFWRYKHGCKCVNLGLPAGYVNPGEKPVEAAERELLEETGYRAERWQPLGSFVVDGNRGLCQAHLFMATNLEYITTPNPDDLEEMNMVVLALNELRDHLYSGSVKTLGVAAAIAVGLNALSDERKDI